MKTTVIYHSADFDGIFCREIARKFLPDAELIGWNFGDKPLVIPAGPLYVIDLPLDRPFGFDYARLKADQPLDVPFKGPQHPNGLVWIDHHKTSIDSHPTDIQGYRIDGVAACRLAWQWFQGDLRPCNCDTRHSEGHYDYCPRGRLPSKQDFIDRKVVEPKAVRLAGEYDIWDKRDPDAETFQYGLRFVYPGADFWEALLDGNGVGQKAVLDLLEHGRIAQSYQHRIDSDLVTQRSYRLDWEGLNWIVLNTGRFNSLTFAALDKPETGHDALLGYMFNGKVWTVSLYHAKHRTDLDLSEIAKKYGGGGHRGACGFTSNTIPFHTP